MKQIKLLKVYRNDSNKDGQPYKTKDGKPFTLVKIMFEEEGQETWATCCDFDGWTEGFKSDEVVSVQLEQNGDYLNFKKVTRIDVLENRVDTLEAIIRKLVKQKQ